jgi:hypothetical protein
VLQYVLGLQALGHRVCLRGAPESGSGAAGGRAG